jgi:hypothetical protein
LEACERVNMTEADWQRQEGAFGLLRKVYAQRAKIRGERSPIQSVAPMHVAPDPPSSGNSFIDQFRA